MNDRQTNESWQQLQAVIPEIKNVEQNERAQVMTLIRRQVFFEQAEETESVRILRPEDQLALRQLVESLKIASAADIMNHVDTLQLSAEEREEEVMNWAFRNQSASGELLIDDKLIPFKLVRAQENFYLLIAICKSNAAANAFSQVFGKKPDLFSAKAFAIPDQPWGAWAWFIGPDEAQNQLLLEQTNELWLEMNK